MARTFKEIEEQMASVGIYIPPGFELYANRDNWKRFKPRDSRFKRGKEAWFAIWEHSLSSGKKYLFGVFGIGSESYRIENKRTGWTAEEKIEIDNRQAECQRVIDEAIRKKREQATQRAASMWDSVATQHSVAADHPYVQKKKIKPAGARQLGGSILIPLNRFTDSGTALVGLQTIAEAEEDDGSKSISKKFLYGSETKGSWALIGQISKKTEIVYLCEGWATGCSVYEAIKLPVVVAFSAGNLEPVLTEFKKKYPDIFFIIAADNDCHYADRLQADVKSRLNYELRIFAQRSSSRIQYVDTPEGHVCIEAYWGEKDGETCVYYAEKHPGQKQFGRRTLLNIGVAKAKAAARQTAAKVICPKFAEPKNGGTDFNDLATEEGIEVVRNQLDSTKAAFIEFDKGSKKSSPENKSKNVSDLEKEKEKIKKIVNELGERFVHVYPDDVCWDLQEKLLVKIGVLKSCYDSKLVTGYLNNSFGNLKRVRKDQLVFRPGGNVPDGCINIFTGWHTNPDPNAQCDLILAHLFNICGEDENVFDWVLKWLAYPIQNPGAKMHTALVVFGEREGTGKGMFFDVMERIYGRQYSRHVDQQLMTSRFNAWLSQKLFIVADEVITSKERKELKGKLKNLITSPVHQLEEKNQPVREEDNFTNFVFLSNEMPPLALDWFDRRYMVIEYNADHPQKYFKDLSDEIENGGVAAFCHYLLKYNLEGFGPSTRPIETEASRNLRMVGTDSARRFIMDWLDGETPFPVGPAPSQDLFRAYQLWAPAAGERSVMNAKMFGIRASSILPKMEKLRAQIFKEEFNPEIVGASREYLERRVTVYFPGVDPVELSCNPPAKDILSPKLREFQEAVYSANRRFRNYGHI